MLKRLLTAIVFAVILLGGPASSQEWGYLTPEQLGQPDLYMAGMRYRGNSVSIEIDHENSKLVMAVKIGGVSKTDELAIVVERNTENYVRPIPRNKPVVHLCPVYGRGLRISRFFEGVDRAGRVDT